MTLKEDFRKQPLEDGDIVIVCTKQFGMEIGTIIDGMIRTFNNIKQGYNRYKVYKIHTIDEDEEQIAEKIREKFEKHQSKKKAIKANTKVEHGTLQGGLYSTNTFGNRLYLGPVRMVTYDKDGIIMDMEEGHLYIEGRCIKDGTIEEMLNDGWLRFLKHPCVVNGLIGIRKQFEKVEDVYGTYLYKYNDWNHVPFTKEVGKRVLKEM